ncbi:MAG: pentapeptide repeat-containing protein [Pseudomonadota bacterium]
MGDDPEAGSDQLNIDNMYLCGSTLTRVNLSGLKVRDAVITEARFEDVNLSKTAIENANLSGVTLRDVNLSDATISHARLCGLAITDADLTGMTIDGILVSDLIALWDRQKM